MSMDKLAASLLAEAEKEGKKELSIAKKESDKIIKEAQDKRKEKMDEAEKSVKERLEAQKRERLAWAQLEKKRILAEAKEDAVNTVLEELFTQLPKLRKHKSYPKFLKEKAEKGIQELTGKVTVHVVKGDKKYLSSIKSGIKEDLNAGGGVLIVDNSKKIRVNYTLEALYEQKKPELRKIIYSSLFGRSK